MFELPNAGMGCSELSTCKHFEPSRHTALSAIIQGVESEYTHHIHAPSANYHYDECSCAFPRYCYHTRSLPIVHCLPSPSTGSFAPYVRITNPSRRNENSIDPVVA